MNSAYGSPSVAVATPGGLARQYRVQYQTEVDGIWHMHATYRTRSSAEQCLSELAGKGYRARLVAYDRCASAN